jgi:hypothetical protein
MGLDSSAPTVSSGWLRQMRSASAVRRDRSPWKSPLMAWSTVCDDYFRVADHLSARSSASGLLKFQLAHVAVEGIQKVCWIRQARKMTTIDDGKILDRRMPG